MQELKKLGESWPEYFAPGHSPTQSHPPIGQLRSKFYAFNHCHTLTRHLGNSRVHWWARQDSNLGPRDYESPALPLSYGPACGVICILQHLRFTALTFYGT